MVLKHDSCLPRLRALCKKPSIKGKRMTVAVSCNLSDGVILGVDSAVSVPGPGGISKVYETGEKLFQLGDLAVGIATYGLGAIGDRSIGSYLREFEKMNPRWVISHPTSMRRTCEHLRKFFLETYRKILVPVLEQAHGKPFEQIPPNQRPGLGLVLGGFSRGQYLSEVWHILIPTHDKPDSSVQERAPGQFGTNWFALFGPIARYVKGYDPNLMRELLAYIEKEVGKTFTDEQQKAIRDMCNKVEVQFPFGAMPIEEGISHTRFLVELVIQHHRYASGAPVVGGSSKIGMVTYRGGQFQILDTERN
jgi:hypothetical protein